MRGRGVCSLCSWGRTAGFHRGGDDRTNAGYQATLPKPACLYFGHTVAAAFPPSRLTAHREQGGAGLASLAFRRASFPDRFNNSGLSLLGPGPPLVEKYALFPAFLPAP